jgi:glycine dehydrogenase subunit 1
MAYLFNTEEDREAMLQAIGAASVAELFESIPSELRMHRPLAIPPAMSEIELTQHAKQLAGKNLGAETATCFLGGGAYDHFIPAVVDAIASRGEFYTSYTPYQPEVSQGNLQVMFEYETLICQLTGMDVSNASLYDGASASVEAALMCLAQSDGRKRVVVPESLHPEYRACLRTYFQWIGAELVEVATPDGTLDIDRWNAALDDNTACVILPQPNFFGIVEDLKPFAAAAKKIGASVVACVDAISLGILDKPSNWSADVVVAEGQSLGNPLQYGGPYLGILACREAFVRRLPGRIAGQTIDRAGKRCWVLTLQTREQHIRREKATSNICTNQGLFALRAAIYLSLLGPQGLKETAILCGQKGQYFKQQIKSATRFEVAFHGATWREFVIRDQANDVTGAIEHLTSLGILGGIPLGTWYPHLADCFMVAVTEKRTKAEIDSYIAALNQLSVGASATHA